MYSALEPSSFEPNTTLTVEAIFAPENLARLRSALNEEMARAVRDGFIQGEVADAKRALLQERALARTQDARLAAELARRNKPLIPGAKHLKKAASSSSTLLHPGRSEDHLLLWLCYLAIGLSLVNTTQHL